MPASRASVAAVSTRSALAAADPIEATLTLLGNLVADPELRRTSAGIAVVDFTIAATPRVLDRATNEWRDGETLFQRSTAWRNLAEHIAASLHKSDRVFASGALRSRTWQTDAGEKRTSVDLEIDEIGPSLRYATATVSRARRGEAAQE